MSYLRIPVKIDYQQNSFYHDSSLYIKEESLVVCLFVGLTITEEPLDRFASNFDCGTFIWKIPGTAKIIF